MASDLGVGDAETAQLVITPADTDTLATLTVTAADGTETAVTVSGGALEPVDGGSDLRQTWTSDAPVAYDQPGRWVLHWVVTGTGEGAEDLEVFVVASPVAGGPTWTPGRSRVANYVPKRTLERSLTSTNESQDVYDLTFTANTIPSGLQIDRLIADGVAWVSGRVYPLNSRLEGSASVVAALYAAAACERGFPDDSDSLQRANDLEKRMDALMADLLQANSDANNGTDDGFDIVYPVWSFPAADPRYDSNCYW